MWVRGPRRWVGDGAHRDWAERTRAEWKVGYSLDKVGDHQQNESEFKVRPEDLESNDEDRVENPASDANEGHAEGEPSTIAEEEALLTSWLDSTGHSEDAWAEKLLGKRGPKVSEENKQS